MIDYDWFATALAKNGYDGKVNVSDFWFANKTELENKIFKFNVPEQRDLYSLTIRWKSEIGQVCSQAIKDYINTKRDEHSRLVSAELATGKIIQHSYAVIDFLNFTFEFNAKQYDLRTFGESFETSNFFAAVDARGINLTGIQLLNVILKNVQLSGADFSNAHIWQVRLENANLTACNFFNARLASIQIDTASCLNGNLINAFINAVDVTNSNFHGTFSEISYWNLLKKAISGTDYTSNRRNYTEFILVNATQIDNPDLLAYKQYVEWYLKISNKIRAYESNWKGNWLANVKDNWPKRISIILQILTTKYWSSYKVFGAVVLSLIIVLGFIFSITTNNFIIPERLRPVDFIDGIYFVVVTFATIGYGDISPANHAGQIFVIITALLGYLCLAIFVFLLSKKIDDN